MKAESDDLRLNCVAFLTVLAQKGLFQITSINDVRRSASSDIKTLMQTAEDTMDNPPLVLLFAEAVKGPLLSPDSQVQVATLDLLFLFLSWEDVSGKEIEVFVEQNIADYAFEILRLSVDSSQTKGCKDSLISACIQVLDLLSIAEKAFIQRLATGLATLVPVLHHVANVPFHPVQTETLMLVWTCVTNWPGIVSKSDIEEISFILSGMLKKNIDGEIGMSPSTFTLVCSILIALMKCSSSNGVSSFLVSIQDASRNAILTCLSHYDKYPSQILHSLYLLKEAYVYSHGENLTSSICTELRGGIIDICKTHVLPWFMRALNDIEEEDIALAVFESFHTILLEDSGTETKIFANILFSFSWFSFSFGLLGLFPTEKMKWRVYLLFSLLSEVLIGDDSGQCIRDAALHLPSDPVDLLFLLGQRSSQNLELSCCQSAVLMLLHISSLNDDRIAEDKLVLASLEQYIILNSNEYLYGSSVSGMLKLLINLYALYRSLAKMSYQIAYSPEAERIMFHLLAEKEWDLLTMRIHLTSLQWLFQQERICKLLSLQILKFCRYNLKGQQMVVQRKNNQNIDLRVVADLVASGDNFAGLLFVFVLGELVDEVDKEIDIGLVLRTIQDVIEISPAASAQLCMHGIASAFQKLYFQSRYSSCPDIFLATSELAFMILQTVKSESISDDDIWVGIVVKLMDYLIPSVAADGWSRETLIVVGIFSLILHHSTDQKLVESSKSILMSTPLVSMINDTITEACSKGPALIDHDETTRTGEVLVFVLALLFFAFRSSYAILPGIVDCQHLLDNSSSEQPLPYTIIKCHDLCKLIHFGSYIIKLVASYHLVEIFSRISETNARKPDELIFKRGYLLSASAVLEGLIFSSDIQVSMNCSLCLSMIIGWQDLQNQVPSIERDSWFRLIVEELAVSLAVPCLASKSFTIHHKPAIHVAVSLLRMKQAPPWMSSVFDESCICGIIKNISASNLSPELVLLFRQLLNSGYLKDEHISSLNRVFQECRRCMYRDNIGEVRTEEHAKNNVAAAILGDLRNASEFLIDLMKSQSSINIECSGSQSEHRRLLEEIDLFSKCLMVDD
nr:protein PRD1 [Ipomoea batatas]